MNLDTSTVNVLLVAIIGFQTWIVRKLHAIDLRLRELELRPVSPTPASPAGRLAVLLFGLTVLWSVAGCASTQRERSAANGNVEFVRTLQTGPVPSITFSNGVLNVRPQIHETLSTQSQASVWSEFQKKIPASLGLILCGIGLLVLLLALALARRQSAAVNAAYRVADEAIAHQIRRLRDRAIAGTDPVLLAELAGEIAALESQRGRLLRT